MSSQQKKLAPDERSALLSTLQGRFEHHCHCHPGLEWATLHAKLAANPPNL